MPMRPNLPFTVTVEDSIRGDCVPYGFSRMLKKSASGVLASLQRSVKREV